MPQQMTTFKYNNQRVTSVKYNQQTVKKIILDGNVAWGLGYKVSASAGYGVSSVYINTSDNATSGDESGAKSYWYDATVHAYAKVTQGNLSKYTAPSSWTLISSDSSYAYYKFKTWTIIEDDGSNNIGVANMDAKQFTLSLSGTGVDWYAATSTGSSTGSALTSAPVYTDDSIGSGIYNDSGSLIQNIVGITITNRSGSIRKRYVAKRKADSGNYYYTGTPSLSFTSPLVVDGNESIKATGVTQNTLPKVVINIGNGIGAAWLGTTNSITSNTASGALPSGSYFPLNTTVYCFARLSQEVGAVGTDWVLLSGTNLQENAVYRIGSEVLSNGNTTYTFEAAAMVLNPSYQVKIYAGTGVKSVYTSTSSNATSGNVSGTTYEKGSTVYGFAVLDRDVGGVPNTWTLISGTKLTKGAIYRVGSATITGAYSFGTQSATLKTYRALITDGSNISSVYTSTSSTATSGNASGTYYNDLTTIYGFAKLARDVTSVPSAWSLISGSALKTNAIYCVGSKRIDAADINFGTQNATVASYTVTFTAGTGIASMWSSSSASATSSGNASGYAYPYQTTVYVYFKLSTTVSKVPDGWTLVSGTALKANAVYRKTISSISSNQALGTISATIASGNLYNWNFNSPIATTADIEYILMEFDGMGCYYTALKYLPSSGSDAWGVDPYYEDISDNISENEWNTWNLARSNVPSSDAASWILSTYDIDGYYEFLIQSLDGGSAGKVNVYRR